MRPIALSVAAVAILCGCMVGTTVKTFGPANSPGGATIVLHMRTRTIAGELIAIEKTTVVMVSAGQVYRVVSDSVRRVEAPYGGPRFGERMARVSRYPSGLTPALERRLLEAYGQPSIPVIMQ